MSTWSLDCTGCGKCCNSAPSMSWPELFHHQARFIGCLALRRVTTSCAPDGSVAEGQRFLHPIDGTQALWLTTHAYDDGVSGRCPALDQAGRCSIHADRKPAICAAVPLEPLLPDAAQTHLLERRAREAAFMGARCITPSLRGLPLIVDGAPAPSSRDALERRRADCMLEKRIFGDVVFRKLPPELLTGARLPTRGLLTLSIVPALAVVAGASQACRRRCVEYLQAQARLIDVTLDHLPRPSESVERQLRALSRSGRAFLELLEESPSPPGAALPPGEVAVVESWLGLRAPAGNPPIS